MARTYKIGIIGSGKIGGTLGVAFAKAGHQVMFSSRNPEKLQPLVGEAGQNAQTGSIEQAFDFGEVILFAFPFGSAPEVAQKVGDASGKIIIDANNYYPQRDGEQPGVEMKAKNLLQSEWTSSYFPGAHIVKAFNTIYFARLQDKAFATERKLGVLYAASSPEGQKAIETLLESIHFDGLHLGDLSKTKIMQPGEKLYNLESLTKEEMQQML